MKKEPYKSSVWSLASTKASGDLVGSSHVVASGGCLGGREKLTCGPDSSRTLSKLMF